MLSTLIPAFMMFVWDYVIYMNSINQHDCVRLFVGDTFPRKIFFFILKIITMQIQPSTVYFITFYKNKDDFNLK